MNFKRGIEPREALQIGTHSPEYIAYAREKMKSQLQRPHFSPAEKFLWDLIENEKYEMDVESEFLIDMSSGHYMTKKVADIRFTPSIKTIKIGTYKILRVGFSPYMDFMHPLIDLKFLYEKKFIDVMTCYPKSLKRHCKFTKK